MDPIIEDALEDLRQESRYFLELEDHQLFTPLAIKYFWQRGDFTRSDYISKVVDGPGDGGIDAVIIPDEEEIEIPILLQAKFREEISKDECLEAAQKIARTCADFRSNRFGGYSRKLRKVVRETVEDLPDKSKIFLVTSADPNEATKRNITKSLKGSRDLMKYDPQILFGNDLAEAIKAVENPKYEVKEDTIEFDNSAGRLVYSLPGEEEKCVIVNIRASSLHRLNDLYGSNGLYGHNLREFVPDQKVDKDLKKSIDRKPEMFWIKNNGITIGCSDYHVDGDKIRLYDFSIINGCQTTSNIGKADAISDDLYLVCKIIKEQNKDNLSEFALAANEQKPIKPRDLKANEPEQKQLREDFKAVSPEVRLLIKRGEEAYSLKKLRSKNMEKWQQITNDKYGQLVMAFYLQRPWTSNAGPMKLFNEESNYDSVFKNNNERITDVDILRLYGAYEEWIGESRGDLEQGILTRGRWCVMANIAVMAKMAKESRVSQEDLDRMPYKFSGKLFSDQEGTKDFSDDDRDKLFSMFDMLYQIQYELLEEQNSEDDPSNSGLKTIATFYKTAPFYRKVKQRILHNLRENSRTAAKKDFDKAKSIFNQ